MAQLDFPVSANRFITVTYQSNNYLNDKLDNQVKQEIAKAIVSAVTVLKIHSYVHGQIIIEVEHDSAVDRLRKVIKALAKPMASQTPSLLYSVDLASYTGAKSPHTSCIYVDGDSVMNNNFIDSIKDFYPKKSK